MEYANERNGGHWMSEDEKMREILKNTRTIATVGLSSSPDPVDVVQIFRRPEDVPPLVDQAIQKGAKVVWMQEGITNPEAAARAEAAGLQVVQDHCMRVEHRRLMGGPSW